MQYVFYYEVTVSDLDYKGTTPFGGFLTAEDFTAAMRQIEAYYGTDLISVDALYGYENELVSIPVEMARAWKKNYETEGDSFVSTESVYGEDSVSK